MNRFTIWRKGLILGTYSGAKESDALDALAKEEGHADFEASCRSTGLTRDDYKVQKAQ